MLGSGVTAILSWTNFFPKKRSFNYTRALLKALTDHLVGGREYTYSIRICKLEARKFFYLILNGLHHKKSKKLLYVA